MRATLAVALAVCSAWWVPGCGESIHYYAGVPAGAPHASVAIRFDASGRTDPQPTDDQVWLDREQVELRRAEDRAIHVRVPPGVSRWTFESTR